MTLAVLTLQNKAIFSFASPVMGFSVRQTITSGWMPAERSARTLLCVGLVFSSPAVEI